MNIKVIWIIRALFYKPFLGSIGNLSYLGKPLYFKNMKRIFIGAKVRIYPNSRIEVVSKNCTIIIEDDVSIGQGLHLISNGKLQICSGSMISANVLITDVDHEFRSIDQLILKQPLIYKKTRIGSNCFIGYGAVIQAGTILGKQCIVGANAVVRGTFPDYCVIVGVPAKIVKRYNATSKTWEKTDSKGNFINE